MTTDAYSDWDAAYVLGALAATDRREFERHLAGCAECSAAVAELAGLPGLLAKVPVAEVEMSERPPLPVPQTLLPRLVRSVARRRRRSRALVVGSIFAAAAAAAAAAIVLAVPLILPTPQVVTPTGSASVTSVVLTPVVSSPLHADVKLVPEGWGTRLEMNCRYDATASTPPGYSTGEGAGYAMFVTDASGRSMQVATWTATPGSTVEPSGTTSLAVADISSVDIRSGSDGRVLLSGRP